MARACFPNASQFPTWETLFPVSVRFLFQDADYAHARDHVDLRYTAGNFNKHPSMRARASERSSNFCEQFEQRRNFASTFKLDGTILYPSYRVRTRLENPCKPLNFRSPISRPWKYLNFVFGLWKSLIFYWTRSKIQWKQMFRAGLFESRLMLTHC